MHLGTKTAARAVSMAATSFAAPTVPMGLHIK